LDCTHGETATLVVLTATKPELFLMNFMFGKAANAKFAINAEMSMISITSGWVVFVASVGWQRNRFRKQNMSGVRAECAKSAMLK
jgi:hypothetical protein